MEAEDIELIHEEIAKLQEAEAEFAGNFSHFKYATLNDGVGQSSEYGTTSKQQQQGVDDSSATIKTCESLSQKETSQEGTDSSEQLELCLALNKKLQTWIYQHLKKISTALDKNKHLQEQLSDEVGEMHQLDGWKRRSILLYCKPYFKDFEGSFPVPNEETLRKQASGEIDVFLKPSKAWSREEKKILRNCVKADVLKRKLRPYMNWKQIEFDKMETVVPKSKEHEETINNLILLDRTIDDIKNSTDLAEVYGRLDEEVNIDWMKIANVDFKGQRSPENCRSFWMNAAHPLLNSSPWTDEEDGKLVELARKFEGKNWKEISENLGTHRSAFMCLKRYQMELNPLLKQWSLGDDRLLERHVKRITRAGKDVSWARIARYVKSKSAFECQERWGHLKPRLDARTKWTDALDQILIDAVKVLGFNWTKIATFIPGKNGNQCRDRWANSLNKSLKLGKWNRQEDRLLWKAVRKDGLLGKWTQISQNYLPGRSDNQILLRYRRLQKYEAMEKKSKDAEGIEPDSSDDSSDCTSLRLPKKPDDYMYSMLSKGKKNKEDDNDEVIYHISEQNPDTPNSYSLRKRARESTSCQDKLSIFEGSESEESSELDTDLASIAKKPRLDEQEPTQNLNLEGNLTPSSNGVSTSDETDATQPEEEHKASNGKELLNVASKTQQSVGQELSRMVVNTSRKLIFTNKLMIEQHSKKNFKEEIEEKVKKLLKNALKMSNEEANSNNPSSSIPLLPANRTLTNAFLKLMNQRRNLVLKARLFKFPEAHDLPLPWQRTLLEKFVESSRTYRATDINDLFASEDHDGNESSEEMNTIIHIQELLSSRSGAALSRDEVVSKHHQASKLWREIKFSKEYKELSSKFVSLFFWPLLLNYNPSH